jgi:hypothetical protein
MSETVSLIPIEEEDLGPTVLKMRLKGMTAAQISRERLVGVHQVHQALDRVLPTG